MDDFENVILAEQKEKRQNFIKGALTGALIMFVVACVAAAGIYFLKDSKTSEKKSASKESTVVVDDSVETKLELLQALIQAQFLNQDSVDQEKLLDGIYKGYIDGLDDPYSVYYSKEETKELQESTAGEFGGIGVTMSQDRETNIITLLNVVKDGPADKAGVKEGDILYKVEGEDITGEENSAVVSKVRGEIGTEVKITVVQKSTGAQADFTLKREKIKDETVQFELKEDGIGYIYVKEFDTITLEQFQNALDELNKQNMKGLIVDLRNNGGGNLSTVCDMLNLLLPKGTIVYTQDKNGNKNTYSSDGKNELKIPMAVLVNGYSASASEIFAGAIQDYALGDIIGETTFGKGVVQEIYDLKDGTSVKLTKSEYFTPKGRNIQGTGITPDVEVTYQYNEANPEADNQLDTAISNIQEKLK